MVSALSRKEPEQIVIYLVSANSGYSHRLRSVKPRNDNFPYALQEFIKSHMDLPSLDEITNKQPDAVLDLNRAK